MYIRLCANEAPERDRPPVPVPTAYPELSAALNIVQPDNILSTDPSRGLWFNSGAPEQRTKTESCPY